VRRNTKHTITATTITGVFVVESLSDGDGLMITVTIAVDLLPPPSVATTTTPNVAFAPSTSPSIIIRTAMLLIFSTCSAVSLGIMVKVTLALLPASLSLTIQSLVHQITLFMLLQESHCHLHQSL